MKTHKPQSASKDVEKIQKWKPSNSDINKIKMEASTNGKYVKYSDYLLAIEQLKKLRFNKDDSFPSII